MNVDGDKTSMVVILKIVVGVPVVGVLVSAFQIGLETDIAIQVITTLLAGTLMEVIVANVLVWTPTILVE